MRERWDERKRQTKTETDQKRVRDRQTGKWREKRIKTDRQTHR